MDNIDLNLPKFSQLRARMDRRMRLYHLHRYVMKDKLTNTPIKGAYNVTLNDPRVFADTLISILQSDKRIIDITDTDATKQVEQEKSYDRWLYANDVRLSDEMIEALDFCYRYFGTLEGWIGCLCLLKYDSDLDLYQPWIQPIDVRWATWEVGGRGLAQGSYKIRMDKTQAEDTYKKKLAGKKRDVYFDVVWDTQDYGLFESAPGAQGLGQKITTVHHGMGICPILIRPIPTSPMTITNGYLQSAAGPGGSDAFALAQQGQDVYAGSEDIIEYMNDITSVWATVDRMQFLAPLIYKGRSATPELFPGTPGTTTKVNPGETIEPLQLKDFSPAAQNLVAQMFARWERATMSSINYGQMSFELSALAVADVKNDKDKKAVPIRKGISEMHRRQYDCLRYQLLHTPYATKIDEKDEDWAFKIDKKLYEEQPTFNCRFFSISPQENIANTQLAQQQVNIGLPRKWTWRNTIQVENPDELDREAKQERAYQICPEAEIYESAMAKLPGRVDQSKIDETVALIYATKLESVLKLAAGTLTEPLNPASQPKQDIRVGRASSEKLAAAQAKQTGQQQMQNAQQGNLMAGGQ